MKIVTLRVNGIISPASAAGHIVLSSSLTAWDIRGTRPDRQDSVRVIAPCQIRRCRQRQRAELATYVVEKRKPLLTLAE